MVMDAIGDPKVYEFQSRAEFYPFYLSQHRDRTCRRLHIFGSTGGLLWIARAFLTGNPLNVLYGIIFGYFCAWVGHFVFEKNRPATFKYPSWSFQNDWVMLYDTFTGKLPL
jgi:hypothetical protein